MTYLGDIRLGETVDFKFTTRQISGAPTTLAGTPSVAAYPGNSTTEITAGITLSVDFDSRTGLNNVRIVATSGNGYATATNYAVVITAGTVNSVSVVGETVAHFSIEARSALMPTTAARTLDVSAGGEAGVDWANVGSPTTSLALTGTTIASTQKVDVDTIKTNPVVNGGTVTFPTTATLASTTNITAAAGCAVSSIGNNVITAASINADAITAAKIADGAIDAATFAAGAINAAAIAADAITDAKVAADVTIASVTGAVGSVTAGVTVTTNNDKTGYALTSAYDFAKGTVAMTESYAADGATMTPAQALHMIWSFMAEKNVSGTTLTAKKLDGSTSSMTFTLDNGTTPAAITRAT